MSLRVSKRYSRDFEIYTPPSLKIKKKSVSSSPPGRSGNKSKLYNTNRRGVHNSNKGNAFESLLSELAFSYDSLATINVMFNSLRHAYASCDIMKKDKEEHGIVRLGDRERELLAAYDDLGLQVSHLEKKIALLESRLIQLKKGTSYSS
ncbi:hypothetical protein K501DRAFT_282745 [Backusella circina FSU 941]|nr:hypothetical protein K501DRAFT_282745 [Backusella circina FSU 941]